MKSGPEAATEFRRNETTKIGASIEAPLTDQEWKQTLKRDMTTRLIEHYAGEIRAGRAVLFDNGSLGIL